MKKVIFSALLAVVAIGGAFAGNASKIAFADYNYTPSGGSCTNTTTLPSGCGSGTFTCKVTTAPGRPTLFNGTCANPGSEVKSTIEP